MTWTLVWMTMTLTAGTTADNAKEAMAAEELKEADQMMEEALPAEAEDLEKDMKKARKGSKKKGAATEADAQAGGTAASPGEETGDWAEEQRWDRYNKRAKDHGHKHRRRRDPNAPAGAEADGPWVGAERPEFLVRRRPLLGLALGGVVGFGTGYFYGGEVRKGIIFAVLDAIFAVGFVSATVELNRLVVEHDFRSGQSLANGDREFGKREANLYATSVVLALAGMGSHVFQAVGGFLSAKRTNQAINSFSFVPTGNGAMLNVTW